MKKTVLIALLLTFAVVFTACGQNYAKTEAAFDASYDDYDYDAAPAAASGASFATANRGFAVEEAAEMPEKVKGGGDSGASSPQAPVETERKMIKNGNYTIETLEYDNTIASLEQLIESSGGYIQNSTTSGTPIVDRGYYNNRYATYVIRIPAAGYTAFEESLAECGTVTSKNVYVNEVTDYYYDTTAHISALQAEEEQLLELLKSAKELDGIIALHTRLSDVRYEIESLQGTIRRLDNQISFSTITVNVQEVSEPTRIREVPKTLGERISDRFNETWHGLVDFCKDVVVFFAGNIIILAIWAIIIIVIVLIIKKIVKKAKAAAAASTKPAPSKDGGTEKPDTEKQNK
ncbi:MAG: DUF4349 domain-containing protein [Clostridia bacterium]|nr:DUF4349 domain-containing protein [Clostridia bacterium]